MTVQEYIGKFKEPYRSQLVKNNMIDVSEEISDEGIQGLFNWSQTPEGFDYWDTICNSIETGSTEYFHNGVKVIDFLNTLKEPYCSQAISYSNDLYKVVSSLRLALNTFNWGNTIEGHRYWRDIIKDMNIKNYTPYIKEEYLFYLLQNKIN